MNYLSKYKNKENIKEVTVTKTTKISGVLRNFCFVFISALMALGSILIIKSISKSLEYTQSPAVSYDVFENGEKDA